MVKVWSIFIYVTVREEFVLCADPELLGHQMSVMVLGDYKISQAFIWCLTPLGKLGLRRTVRIRPMRESIQSLHCRTSLVACSRLVSLADYSRPIETLL